MALAEDELVAATFPQRMLVRVYAVPLQISLLFFFCGVFLFLLASSQPLCAPVHDSTQPLPPSLPGLLGLQHSMKKYCFYHILYEGASTDPVAPDLLAASLNPKRRDMF